MPQFNPYDLPRRPLITKTREFTQPGSEAPPLKLTLTGTDETAFLSQIDETAARLIEKFTGREAAPMPPLKDGTPVTASKDICFVAARLMTMQAGGPGDDPAAFRPFPFVFWAACAMTAPQLFRDVAVFANTLIDPPEDEEADEFDAGLQGGEQPAEEAAEQEHPPQSGHDPSSGLA